MIKSEAVEITTFKLKGYTCEQFIAANNEIDDFLKRQPGFISRRIFQKTDRTIVDMLIWDSVKNGTESMHKLMDELSESVVHDMIDQSTVAWNINQIEHQINNKFAQ